MVCAAPGLGARIAGGSACCWHCQWYVGFPAARAPGFCVAHAVGEAPPIFGSGIFDCVSVLVWVWYIY